jgi:uncharacterized YigZ family protein
VVVTLSKPSKCEREIRKSKFIARAAPAGSPEQAMEFVEKVSEPQASHNCWAYRVGNEYRFSDDGEPAGTAGKPILGAIEKHGLDRVVVVVTRYFGGIKLGAGGLARAYLGTSAECLRSADRREIRNYVIVRFEADFDAIGVVHTTVERQGASIIDESYTASGIDVDIRIDENSVKTLRSALLEATRGKGRFFSV